MGADISPCVEAHARGATYWRLTIGTIELNAARRQSINMGRFKFWVAIAREVIPSKLIAHNEQNISGVGHFSLPLSNFHVARLADGCDIAFITNDALENAFEITAVLGT